jgi:hypothetical protein
MISKGKLFFCSYIHIACVDFLKIEFCKTDCKEQSSTTRGTNLTLNQLFFFCKDKNKTGESVFLFKWIVFD